MLHVRHSAEKTLFIKILAHRLFVRLIGDSFCADRGRETIRAGFILL